ncbi:MAG TPA: ABC transporter ATP-binding protein [Candidatus Elarobacter sp.]
MNHVVALDRAGIRRGERWIWRDVSLEIPAGSFTLVLGPNGAGKSTLLNVVLGLLPLSEGSVQVDHAPPRRGNPAIGYMPQQRGVDRDLAIRGRDVVRFGVDGHHWGVPRPGATERVRRARVDAAIGAVHATAYADRRVGELSGGEAQRLYLAQALVGEPWLLVLDEPLASLDLPTAADLVALIARIKRERGIAAILVAHNLNGLISYADRVIYVAHGRMAAGTPEEVITSETLSRIYDAPVEVLHDRRGRPFVTGPTIEA